MREPKQASVLLVEDSEPIRDAFSILLEESGFRVAGASDGPEALELALSFGPDLVLLDMGLPGMDGLEVARRLKADPATAAIPIVALTGRDDDESRRACFAAGCAAFLLKPVNMQVLLRTIPEQIARARGGDGDAGS